MVGSKEKYKFDLGVKGLTETFSLLCISSFKSSEWNVWGCGNHWRKNQILFSFGPDNVC